MPPSPESGPAIGRIAEDLARRHLEAAGLVLLDANFRCPGSEIDLIMREGDCVVFVEVRFRRSARFGGGAESVDRRKQEKLGACALYYLQRRPRLARLASRFDVVAIAPAGGPRGGDHRIDWIRDAFQTGGGI